MASANDFPARGMVTEIMNGKVVFQPSNTNYALHLDPSVPYKGPINQLILATIHAKAKKVYTVPSGGGFISPLFGSPRTVQGRALLVEEGIVVIRAGVPIIVEIPKRDDAIDLEEGPIGIGSLVNAVTLPGARFEFLKPAV